MPKTLSLVGRIRKHILVAEDKGVAELDPQRKVYWSGVTAGLRTALRIAQRDQATRGFVASEEEDPKSLYAILRDT